jgi:hypothetical protein
MVLNSNGTRYGFSQFWLNCSTSRAYAQEVLDYHSISRFVLRVSRISDRTSFMAYSHTKVFKLHDKHILRVYYYDSKLYDKYFNKVLRAKTKRYLKYKYRKRGQKFSTLDYFNRSLVVRNIRNISRNLIKRFSSFYSSTHLVSKGNNVQDLAFLFSPIKKSKYKFLNENLNHTFLNKLIIDKTLKLLVSNLTSKLLKSNTNKLNKNLILLNNSLVKFNWIKYNTVSLALLRKLSLNNMIFKYLKNRKLFLTIFKKGNLRVHETLKHVKYSYLLSRFSSNSKNQTGTKLFSNNPSNNIVRTFCNKSDDNDKPKNSNPNYKGKNFDPNYHLLSKEQKQALKEKKQKAYEYALAKANEKVQIKGKVLRKPTPQEIARAERNRLKPYPSGPYNSEFLAPYRITDPAILRSTPNFKNSYLQKKKNKERDLKKYDNKRNKSFNTDKSSKLKPKSNRYNNFEREEVLDLPDDDVELNTNFKHKSSNKNLTKIKKIEKEYREEPNIKFRIENYKNKKSSGVIEDNEPNNMNNMKKKGSSLLKTNIKKKVKSFSSYTRSNAELKTFAKELGEYKYPLKDLTFFEDKKKLENDIKNTFIRVADNFTRNISSVHVSVKSKLPDRFSKFDRKLKKLSLSFDLLNSKHSAVLNSNELTDISHWNEKAYLLENIDNLNLDNSFAVASHFNQKALENYFVDLMDISRESFIKPEFLAPYLATYYKYLEKQLGLKLTRLDTSNQNTNLSGGYFSSYKDLKIKMSKHFFRVLNEPTLSYLNYKFLKEIPLILTEESNEIVYSPKLLEFGNFNSILYSRFVARRLKQRFHINETMKVLKGFLRSNYLSGYLFVCSGRFSKKQRSSVFKYREGSVPLSSFGTPVQYAYDLVRLRYGTCCIKVWVAYSQNKDQNE